MRDDTRTPNDPRGRIQPARLITVLLLAAVAAACDGAVEPPDVGGLSIGPSVPQLEVGDAVQLAATVLSSSGSVLSGHPVTWTSTRPQVVAVSTGGMLTAVSPGTAKIRATAGGKTAELQTTVIPPSCTPADASGGIEVGQTRTGTLSATDCRLLGGPGGQGWTLTLGAATIVLISATATGLWPEVVVMDGMMNPVAWGTSDYGESYVVADLPAGGYTVWIASWQDEGGAGAYELTVETADVCDTADAAEVAAGAEVSGNLDDDTCLSPLSWQRAVPYSLELAASATLRFDMSSAAFQPHVVVTDGGDWVVAWGGTSDGYSGAFAELPAGSYTVWAQSAETGGAGVFELSVADVDLCAPASVEGPIQPGESRAGTLAPTSCLFLHGAPAVGYTLQLSETAELRAELASTSFHALVVITDTAMEPLWWSFAGETGAAVLDRRLGAGTYLVWATGESMNTAGGFELALTEIDIPLCEVVGDLTLEVAAAGDLSSGDCVRDDGQYADPWRLVLTSTSTVQIDLTSAAIDGMLFLEDHDGVLIEWNDDGGAGFNSRITRSLPAGEYRVVASSFSPGETGTYSIQARVLSGAGAAGVGRDQPPAIWVRTLQKALRPGR